MQTAMFLFLDTVSFNIGKLPWPIRPVAWLAVLVMLLHSAFGIWHTLVEKRLNAPISAPRMSRQIDELGSRLSQSLQRLLP